MTRASEGMVERLQTAEALIERCERGGLNNRRDAIEAVAAFIWSGDRARIAAIDEMLGIAAYLEAADALLPPGAVWRAYTDDSASVYAASPYNAKAQARYDGFSAVRPLAICAALLRMIAAPIAAAVAAEARRA